MKNHNVQAHLNLPLITITLSAFFYENENILKGTVVIIFGT